MPESSSATEEFEALLAMLKSKHANWHEAFADPGGADDPADQVYFAYREGLIKIGFSGSPRRRLSSA